MKICTAFAFLLTMGSSSAFAPSSKAPRQSTTSLSASVPPANEWKGYYTNVDASRVVQTDADKGFDPLGFSDTNVGLFFMREAEIKHCRLAMVS